MARGPAPTSIDQLRVRIAELEAELALANVALDDPDFLAACLERLLVDSPDLMMEARHIASSLLRRALVPTLTA